MKKALEVFFEIPCLTEKSISISGTSIQKKWFKSADKRYIGQYLQKFIEYNHSLFDFLGVQPCIVGSDLNTSLVFRSSEFIGTIPLRASDTGKQIGDFVVVPRFIGRDRFEDYIEILNLLGTDINPLVVDSLPLASGRNFRPPLYLEAVKFITSLEFLLRINWRKFDNIEKMNLQPDGDVNWDKYAKNEYRIESRLRFPVKKNVLTEIHKEYSELRYVFDICCSELLSPNTPLRVKNSIRTKLRHIEEKLYIHKPLSTTEIAIKASDNPTIKRCKEQANKILNFNLVESTAWRVDFSDVFEKFIQHIFKEVSKETGGRLLPNYKLHSKTVKHYAWELRHLEPDAIYQKDHMLVFIDAKYKSHLLNKLDVSEILKNDHRLDLHQILAYSSFSLTKFSILCYPSDKIECKKTTFTNGVNGVINTMNFPRKNGLQVKEAI